MALRRKLKKPKKNPKPRFPGGPQSQPVPSGGGMPNHVPPGTTPGTSPWGGEGRSGTSGGSRLPKPQQPSGGMPNHVPPGTTPGTSPWGGTGGSSSRRKVVYGAKGLQRGVPKAQQRRNQLPDQGGGQGGPFGGPNAPRPPMGGPGGGAGGGGGLNLPPALQAKLEAQGLKVVRDDQGGWKLVGGAAGYGGNNQQNLKLAQKLASKYDVMSNPWFDPTRAGYGQGNLYDIGTGSGLNNGGSSNVLNDAQLARFQERVGWNVEDAAAAQLARTPKWELTPGNPAGTLGAILSDPAMYQRQLEAARANYQVGAGGTPSALGQSLLDAGTIRTDLPGGYSPGTVNPNGGGMPNHVPPGTTPPIVPRNPGTGPAATPGYTMAGGQLQVSGGPSTAGSTNYATDRPASPGQVSYGQNGNQMGVPKAQQARNQQGGQQNMGAQAEAAKANGGGQQNFLPMTAGYESGRRGAEDALAQQLMAIGVSREQIPAYLAMMGARADTDQGYANSGLMSDMADRGLYESGITPYLQTRDISIPYGRQAQDRSLDAASQYADLASQEGAAYLSYDQQLAELMLQRAADVAASMPLSVSQYNQNRRKTKKKTKKRRSN